MLSPNAPMVFLTAFAQLLGIIFGSLYRDPPTALPALSLKDRGSVELRVGILPLDPLRSDGQSSATDDRRGGSETFASSLSAEGFRDFLENLLSIEDRELVRDR